MDRKTGEELIQIGLVVESLHVIVVMAFGFMLFIAIVLTEVNGGYPRDNIIHRNFGYNNLCLYFDSKPAIYISPPMFLLVTISYWTYAIAIMLRSFIAWKENKISLALRVFMNVCTIWRGVTEILFIICFAVQPVDHYTLVLHTGPFSNMVLAHMFFQVGNAGEYSKL